MRSNLVVLGVTGSIGRAVLRVLDTYTDRFHLLGVSAYSNLERLAWVIETYSPQYVCVGKEDPDFFRQYPGVNFLHGDEGLVQLASLPEAGQVLLGLSGVPGVLPSIAALKARKRVISANKESLVSAGDILSQITRDYQNPIIPIDSEHSALFFALQGFERQEVQTITLTASGGPFRNQPITPETTMQEVMQHPTWNMGSVITVNSATMMNKGLEVLEAHTLFGLDYARIQVLVHPESLVHGMLTLRNGMQVLLAGAKDMFHPVSLGMFYPDTPQDAHVLDLTGLALHFEEPDWERFPLLGLAYEVGRAGGTLPAAMVAANEIFVEAFLAGGLAFHRLPDLVKHVVDRASQVDRPALEEIFIADRLARIHALEMLRAHGD